MKKTERNKPPNKQAPKDKSDTTQQNPEAGSGKQDREQSRTALTGNADIDNPDKQNVSKESITFEQDIENERQNDPERNHQRRKPRGEDEHEVAKQGKDFEPGIDENPQDPL